MTHRTAGSVAALAAVVVSLGATPAGADRSWSAPSVIGPGQDVRLTAATDGSLLASFWTRTSANRAATHAAIRPAGGVFGSPFTPAPQGYGVPVALRGGAVLIVSGGDPGTSSRVRAWAGPLRTLRLHATTIGQDNWDLPVAAADARGRAVAAWTSAMPRRGAGTNLRPRVVMVAARTRAGRWSAPRRISPLPPAPPYGNSRGPRLSATALAIAAGGDGVVVAAWQRVRRIEARISRDGGRTWGRVVRLGTTTFGFPRIGVAVSPRGSFVVGWSTAPVAAGGRTLRSVLATNAPGGGFARPYELGSGLASSTALAPATDQFGTRVLVAYAPDGRGYVAWQSGEAGRVGVRIARFGMGGSAPGSLHLADDGGPTAVLGDLAASGAGVLVAWSDITTTGVRGSVHVVDWPTGGDLGTVARLGTGAGVQVEWSGSGAQAVWTQAGGSVSTVLAAASGL